MVVVVMTTSDQVLNMEKEEKKQNPMEIKAKV